MMMRRNRRRMIVRMKGGRKGSSFDRHRMKRMASEANARAHTVIVISNPTQKSCAISIYEVKRELDLSSRGSGSKMY